MAEWTPRSRNYFDHVSCKNHQGWIRTRQLILVQSSSGRVWCNLQGITPWLQMQGKAKDVSQFRAIWCRAWVYLNSERREKGKHTGRIVEATNLGFEPHSSNWVRLLFVIHPGKELPHGIQPNKVWWICRSILETENGRTIPIWQFNRYIVSISIEC